MTICCVAFGIRARSRTRVRSLRPHPQRLAYHPFCYLHRRLLIIHSVQQPRRVVGWHHNPPESFGAYAPPTRGKDPSDLPRGEVIHSCTTFYYQFENVARSAILAHLMKCSETLHG